MGLKAGATGGGCKAGTPNKEIREGRDGRGL